MRALIIVTAISLLPAAPLLAQTERAYLTGVGGFAASTDTTSGNVVGGVGVRIAPHLLVFGNLGQFYNLQPSDAQPAVDSSMATLAGTTGLSVVGTARVPAWYSVGGLRYEVPTRGRVLPYVLGGIGFARLTPNGQFTYSSGTLPDGSTPVVGTDVTSELVTAGYFTKPPATSAFMYSLSTDRRQYRAAAGASGHRRSRAAGAWRGRARPLAPCGVGVRRPSLHTDCRTGGRG